MACEAPQLELCEPSSGSQGPWQACPRTRDAGGFRCSMCQLASGLCSCVQVRVVPHAHARGRRVCTRIACIIPSSEKHVLLPPPKGKIATALAEIMALDPLTVLCSLCPAS